MSVARKIETPAVDPALRQMAEEILAGLKRARKQIPPKYFYDRRGSELFERITRTEEYYPTRAEAAILRDQGASLAERIGEGALVFEPGAGGAAKIRPILAHARLPLTYVPIDISGEFVREAGSALQREFPGVEVLPVCADFSDELRLPSVPCRRRVAFFPGSTIGNFDPPDAVAFLSRLARVAGPAGAVLVGVDLVKDVSRLEAAYNDREGVTAEFNLNVLRRLRDELGAELDPALFEHRAWFNYLASRIEMHLRAREPHEAVILGERVRFAQGETIHTESSYKYTIEGFHGLAARAGLRCEQVWTDPERLYSFHYLEPIRPRGP